MDQLDKLYNNTIGKYRSLEGNLIHNYTSAEKYLTFLNGIEVDYNIPMNITYQLWRYLKTIYLSDLADQVSSPMKWIGMYIAIASLVCILSMVADLIHGFRSRKQWFPCKYFKINAAFLTVIAIAMKLPVDLTSLMPGYVDKAAKLGSMAFMCTIMANLLPCLATMDNNELLSNIIALGVLVITLVVNVCIQIQTGVLSTYSYSYDLLSPLWISYFYPLNLPVVAKDRDINTVASIYVIFLLVLLMVHVCSSIATLKSKLIIEYKYQQVHETASKEIQPSSGELLTVEKLDEHVISHWIMAGSGSPQFITVCFQTTSASGVICLLVTALHTYTIYMVLYNVLDKDYDSDYGGSMMVILIVQFIGVIIGTIAPVSRCFAALSFKVTAKIISSHFKVFKVESYWTSKLYEWKHASIRLPFRSRNLEVVIENLRRLILNLCIGFQNGVVVVCKVIAVFPFLFMICFLYCFRCMKWLLGKKSNKLEEKKDLSRYVLHLEKEMELGERSLKRLSKSVNRLIRKGAKSQPNNLKNLIVEKSTSCFEGVKKFDQIDDHDVPCVDCWRLPVVTLTTIILSLPKIEEDEIDILLESVKEGLEYFMVVEKSLNAKKDYLGFQKAAADLWQEIRFDKKWLGNQLQNPAFQAYAAEQIVDWFREKANNIISSEDRSKDDTGVENDDSRHKSVCANSMYRITKTILRNCHTNIDVTVSQKELFDSLSSMIADIIAACLTNLPQAIIMKCHADVIEEREASVHDAAQLLGETTEIIETLRGRHIPNMDPSDLPFIEKWRAYLGSP